jgi:hypothetical protein
VTLKVEYEKLHKTVLTVIPRRMISDIVDLQEKNLHYVPRIEKKFPRAAFLAIVALLAVKDNSFCFLRLALGASRGSSVALARFIR